MNLTFFIGNGFDLNLNMKTRYIDVYNGYLNTFSNNEAINKFKADLRKDAMRKYENWSDFEMGMADYACNFKSEADFINCVRDFKEYMVDHLNKEAEKYAKSVGSLKVGEIKTVLLDCFNDIYGGMVPNTYTQLRRLGTIDSVKFINLNYTEPLDHFIYALRSDENEESNKKYGLPLHIHGRLDEDVVLGVDNEVQINNKNFLLTNRGKRAFIKPKFNAEYDSNRVEMATRYINDSDVIYVYGASFGQSDKTWTGIIKDWLLANPNHHLIFNYYDEATYKRCNGDQMIDIEEERKNEILDKMNLSIEQGVAIYSQVHIPIGYNIFEKLKDLNSAEYSLRYYERELANV